MRFIGFYDYTVILTYLSLVSGLVGIKLASTGKTELAVCCLVICGVLDMFDGTVARTKKNRTADQKNFGIQLDSLCDIVCFGVFPAVLLHGLGVDGTVGIIILILYVLCALIRLAFFNVLEINRQQKEDGCAKSYRGLPVTSSAIIFPFFFLLSIVIGDSAMRIIYHILPITVAFMFIFDVPIPKIDIGSVLHRKAEKEESPDLH